MSTRFEIQLLVFLEYCLGIYTTGFATRFINIDELFMVINWGIFDVN